MKRGGMDVEMDGEVPKQDTSDANQRQARARAPTPPTAMYCTYLASLSLSLPHCSFGGLPTCKVACKVVAPYSRWRWQSLCRYLDIPVLVAMILVITRVSSGRRVMFNTSAPAHYFISTRLPCRAQAVGGLRESTIGSSTLGVPAQDVQNLQGAGRGT